MTQAKYLEAAKYQKVFSFLFHLKPWNLVRILNFGAIGSRSDLILLLHLKTVKILFKDQVETNLRNCAKIQITLGDARKGATHQLRANADQAQGAVKILAYFHYNSAQFKW